MTEYMKRHYTKEEKFLADYREMASATADFLGGDWHPKADADDDSRKSEKYFLSTGELSQLAFNGASVHHDENGFSSVQISLRSSKRLLTLRAFRKGGKIVVEKTVDRAPEAGPDFT